MDRAILAFCHEELQALKPLRDRIPRGTLYRHAKTLVRRGWLHLEGGFYQTTAAGLRKLGEARGGRRWGALDDLYPPLRQVPTPVHRAIIELILAAVVARQHPARPDRHPFFVAFGSTLRWKTSLGLFLCQALGLDPAGHVIDCGAESGKSLTVRRSSTGEPTFKREILEAPFVVLDEFLTADPSTRTALSLFLGGRLEVPFENEQLRVCPVSLLTLNPRTKPTLEQQLGLSAPLIRRAILVDLDTVAMPDLATVGEVALEAAREHGPLPLAAPAIDCRPFRALVVALVRAILMSEAQSRVDVEIVVNLASGMTAFLPDPSDAIAQVGYNLGLLAETIGWARPGWIEPVTAFSVVPTRTAASAMVPAGPASVVPVQRGAGGDDSVEPASGRTLALRAPEPPRRRGQVPDLVLSDGTRMRLIWFAHETRRDVDAAMGLLLDYYLRRRQAGGTIETLEHILRLADELELAEVDVETLHAYLDDRQALAAHFNDLPEALRLIETLSLLPGEWDWALAEIAMEAVATLMQDDVALAEVGPFIERHRRLQALGFDETTAEAVAVAVIEAGAVEQRRGAVLARIADVATATVDREALETARHTLQEEVAALEAQTAQCERVVQALTEQRESLESEMEAAGQGMADIEAARAAKIGDLHVLQALRRVLLGKTTDVEAFFQDLRNLDEWRRLGGSPDDWVGKPHVTGLRSKLFAFIQKLVKESEATR